MDLKVPLSQHPRSRGTTKRAHWRPRGDSKVKSVRMANKIARRVAYLIEYNSKKGVDWVLENPISSILWRYRCIRRALRKHKARRVVVFLGEYGASTLKPVSWWTTALDRMHLNFSVLDVFRFGVSTSDPTMSFWAYKKKLRFTC